MENSTMGKDVSPTEWLMDFWELYRLGNRSRQYDLLKEAANTKWDSAKFVTKAWLLALRRQFNAQRYKYPIGAECNYCHWGKPLVRHHIVGLRNGGTNRRLNIMTLCDNCHAYFHPWLRLRPLTKLPVLRPGDVVASGNCRRTVVAIVIDEQHECSSHPHPRPMEVYRLTDTNGRLFGEALWCTLQTTWNGYRKI